jgi:hypothetical protein
MVTPSATGGGHGSSLPLSVASYFTGRMRPATRDPGSLMCRSTDVLQDCISSPLISVWPS